MSESHCEPIRTDAGAREAVAVEADEADADEEPDVIDIEAPEYVVAGDQPAFQADSAGASTTTDGDVKPSKERTTEQRNRGRGRDANPKPSGRRTSRPIRRKKPGGSNGSGEAPSGNGEQK